MDTVDPARFIFSFFFVLGLLGLLAVILKHYANKSFSGKLFSLNMNKDGGRIEVVEARYLDHKSKLLLIKRDKVEHLLLISDGKVTVIESGIIAGSKNDA